MLVGIVHSIHGFNQLNNFLDQLTVGKEITLGQISGSLHLIPNRIKYDVYDGTTSSTRDFGINDPGHMLFKAGNTSIELQAVEQHLGSELRSHNPRYENLQDAVTKALQLPWWRCGTYAPFVVIWCPGTG